MFDRAENDPIEPGEIAQPVEAIHVVATYDRRAGQRLALEGEQLAAVRAREPVVALSAGAGSGKTTVLVERFMDLVTSDNVSPLDILAITFTEKAAAEMKERIIRRFEERGDDANRRRAEAAYISTIHGFCSRLLRENPLAAGVDPAFQIVDGMRLGIFLAEERERIESDPWYLQARGTIANHFGSTNDRLFELIKDCVFLARDFGKGTAAEEPFSVEQHVAESMRRLDESCAQNWTAAREALLAAAGDIADVAVNGPARMASHKRMCELLVELASAEAFDAGWAASFCDVTKFTAGIKDETIRASIKLVLDPARDTMKELSQVDRAEQEAIERDMIAPLKKGIYRHAGELRAHYERLKTEQALLDFEDLQRRALDLLGKPDVRAEYSARFKHVLLDEAQDTNEVQKAIVDALLGGDERSLFAVGDVKQSIYGFRGANVSIFQEIHRGAGTGRLSLRDNYRSRAEILTFANDVGGRFWRNDRSVSFDELVPKFPYADSSAPSPHIQLLLVEKIKETSTRTGRAKNEESAASREREALSIAQRIRCMVEGEDGVPPIHVYDRLAKEYRQARYGDIAVLVIRRTHFGIYERTFADLGIPAIADGGGGFFTGREVQDVISALKAVANPLDELALLTALRSPLFGWSDADLVRLRIAGPRGLWRAMRGGFVPNGADADRHAYDTIASLRQLASSLPPVELITVLLERTAYSAAVLRGPRGRAAAANLVKLSEFARQSAEVDGPDLRRFVKRAELAEAYLAREQDAPVAAEGDDVVLLGTIHGSKGLEWPIVILANLDADFARTDGGSLFSAADGALIVLPKDEDGDPVRPLSYSNLQRAQNARDEQEARRLFYVAMTRAREHLVLTGPIDFPEKRRKVDAFRRPVQWLADQLDIAAFGSGNVDTALGSAELRVSYVNDDAVAELRRPAAADSVEDVLLSTARRSVATGEPVTWEALGLERSDRVSATVRELLAGPLIPLPRPSVIAATTVTQLVYFARCPMVYYLNLVLQVEEHPRARRKAQAADTRSYSAVELGTAVHELLERADFSAVPADEAERLVRETSDLPEGMGERIQHMLSSVLADPLIERARNATRIDREYPFYLNIGGTLVHGVIDLVFTDEGGRGVVVDYKSNDLAAPDRVNVLAEYYRPQIELYALAANKAGLVEPAEATLYFLNKAIARTVPIDQGRLEHVEEKVGDMLSHISRSAWDTEPGEKCRSCGYRKRDFCDVGKRFVE